MLNQDTTALNHHSAIGPDVLKYCIVLKLKGAAAELHLSNDFLHLKTVSLSYDRMELQPSVCAALLIKETLCIKPLTGHQCEGRCQRN